MSCSNKPVAFHSSVTRLGRKQGNEQKNRKETKEHIRSSSFSMNHVQLENNTEEEVGEGSRRRSGTIKTPWFLEPIRRSHLTHVIHRSLRGRWTFPYLLCDLCTHKQRRCVIGGHWYVPTSPSGCVLFLKMQLVHWHLFIHHVWWANSHLSNNNSSNNLCQDVKLWWTKTQLQPIKALAIINITT